MGLQAPSWAGHHGTKHQAQQEDPPPSLPHAIHQHLHRLCRRGLPAPVHPRPSPSPSPSPRFPFLNLLPCVVGTFLQTGALRDMRLCGKIKKTTPPISRQLQILEKRRTLDRAWSRLSLGSLTGPPPLLLHTHPPVWPTWSPPIPLSLHCPPPPAPPLSPPRGQCRAAFIKTAPSIDRIAVADYTSTHWLPFLSSETLPQLLLVYAVLLCLRSRPRFVSEDQGSHRQHCQRQPPTTNSFAVPGPHLPATQKNVDTGPFGDQYIAPPPRHRISPHHQATPTPHFSESTI